MRKCEYGVYIGNEKMLISPFWGGKIVAPSSDLSLMPDLVIEGAYDMGLTNYILKNIHAGMTVVDVGANIGYISVLLGHKVGSNGKVVCYECSPRNFEFLEENVAMNYHHQTHIYEYAIGATSNKSIPFYEPFRFRGSGSTRESIVSSFEEVAEFDNLNRIMVETITIDDHLERISVGKVDFLKMDIEGFEYQAFKGMEKYINQGKINTISFEVNTAALENDLTDLKGLMKEYEQFADFYTINLEGELIEEKLEDVFSRSHTDNLVVKFR